MSSASWRGWVAVSIGVLAITAHTASSYTLSILMKPMLAEVQWDRTTFASAMTLRMLLMVLTLSFAGQLTDRYGTRLVLTIGALVVGVGTFGIAQARSLGQFYPLMALMGPSMIGLAAGAGSMGYLQSVMTVGLLRRAGRAVASGSGSSTWGRYRCGWNGCRSRSYSAGIQSNC